jgi:hypothetical protein
MRYLLLTILLCVTPALAEEYESLGEQLEEYHQDYERDENRRQLREDDMLAEMKRANDIEEERLSEERSERMGRDLDALRERHRVRDIFGNSDNKF